MNGDSHLGLYGGSLALLTDLYQLTMSYGYWKEGKEEEEAIFHMFYRKNPFKGGYGIAAGLRTLVEYLERFSFDESDREYLQELRGSDGKPLFEREFLEYLGALEFRCDLDAVGEGTAVFPQAPLVRVKGPLIQCQLLETALLNLVNFQTLIATKAARICDAAEGDGVIEFGLRRAQGLDGGISASRAAYIGGAVGTSNVLAGKLLGIPVKGTHAHSWVMSFDSELESFRAYGEAMPNNAVFLVDTYDTLEGVRNAVKVAGELRERGHEIMGIRLDSGDLAYLSIRAREILDEGGFQEAKIVASNNLDEHTIKSLKEQGARIDIWGVGTNLATARDQPALGGVYKLGAIKHVGGQWEPRLKLSEQRAKISNPGCLQVRRYFRGKVALGDQIYDQFQGELEGTTIVDPMDELRRKSFDPEATSFKDLLEPVYREGKLVVGGVWDRSLEEIQAHARENREMLHEGIRRFVNPHEYPVGLSLELHHQRQELVKKARQIEE